MDWIIPAFLGAIIGAGIVFWLFERISAQSYKLNIIGMSDRELFSGIWNMSDATLLSAVASDMMVRMWAPTEGTKDEWLISRKVPIAPSVFERLCQINDKYINRREDGPGPQICFHHLGEILLHPSHLDGSKQNHLRTIWTLISCANAIERVEVYPSAWWEGCEDYIGNDLDVEIPCVELEWIDIARERMTTVRHDHLREYIKGESSKLAVLEAWIESKKAIGEYTETAERWFRGDDDGHGSLTHYDGVVAEIVEELCFFERIALGLNEFGEIETVDINWEAINNWGTSDQN